MHINCIESFIHLSRTGSYTKTSDQINVSQPALSRRIKRLEDWLGYDVIDRTTYPVTLTRKGKAFRIVAVQFMKMLQNMKGR